MRQPLVAPVNEAGTMPVSLKRRAIGKIHARWCAFHHHIDLDWPQAGFTCGIASTSRTPSPHHSCCGT
jgi:hypothetical protein